MKATILIVEDEAVVRDLMRRCLEQHGYAVCLAGNGHEAINALKSVPIDLVLTDVLMPDCDGLETIRHIRRHYPHVPVIAVSAAVNRLYLKSALDFGASCTLTKPLRMEQMVQKVQQVLDGRMAGPVSDTSQPTSSPSTPRR